MQSRPGPAPQPAPDKGELLPPDGLSEAQARLWEELREAPHVTEKDRELLLDAMMAVEVRDEAKAAGNRNDYFRGQELILKIRRALKASPQARHQASGGKLKPAVNRSSEPTPKRADSEEEDLDIDE